MNTKAPNYRGRRFINPFDKEAGRRTGKNVRAGKNIRVTANGFENFDDYMSESDVDTTRDVMSGIQEESGGQQGSQDDYKENKLHQANITSHGDIVSSQVNRSDARPNNTCNITANQTSMSQLSQGAPRNRSRLEWLKNRNIGRRTGKNVKAGKKIRVDAYGFENFDDYLSESDASSFLSVSSIESVKPIKRKSLAKRQNGVRLEVEDITKTKEDSDTEHTEEDNNHANSHVVENDANDTDNGNSVEGDIDNDVLDGEKSTSNNDRIGNNKNACVNVSDKEEDGDDDIDGGVKDAYQTQTVNDNEDYVSDSESENSEYDVNDEHRSKSIDVNAENVGDNVDSEADVSDEHEEDNEENVNIPEDSDNDVNGENHIDAKVDTEDSVNDTETRCVDVNGEQHTDAEVDTEDSVNDTGNSDGDVNVEQNTDAEVDTEDSVNETSGGEVNGEQHNDAEVDTEDSVNETSGGDVNGENHTDAMVDTEESLNDTENNGGDVDNEHPTEDISDDEDNNEGESNDEHDTDDLDGSENKSQDNVNDIDNDGVEVGDDQFTNDGDKNAHSDKKEAGEKYCEDKTTNYIGIELDSCTGTDTEENGDDSIRPSQAQSGIDVAGNRSGSITKLNQPSSVVSFNRTKKRLSYSALESSEESKKLIKSRVEMANLELQESKNTSEDRNIKVIDEFLPMKTKQSVSKKHKMNVTEKEKEPVMQAAEESNFMCLASRTATTVGKVTDSESDDDDDDNDDDISVIDDVRHNFTTFNKTGKTNDKTRSKAARKKDKSVNVSSKSETNTRGKRKLKSVHSENKVKKTHSQVRDRRKTTHGVRTVEDVTASSKGPHEEKKGKKIAEVVDDDDDDKVKPKNSKTRKRKNVKSQGSSESDHEDVENSKNSTRPGHGEKDSDEGISNKKKAANRKLSYQDNSEMEGNETTSPIDSIPSDKRRKPTKRKSSSDENNDNESDIGTKSNLKRSKRVKSKGDKMSKTEQTKSIPVKTSRQARSNTRKVTESTVEKRKSISSTTDDNESENPAVLNSVRNNVKQKSKTGLKNLKSRKTKRKQSKGSSSEDDHDIGSDDLEVVSSPGLENTPIVDSQVAVQSHFGSGVSFRVSRRSEMLENIGSGYVGNISVQMAACLGLTPCIAGRGARKSKGRRVTICPEENIEHTLSDGQMSPDNQRSPNIATCGAGTSVTNTPLPSPSSTPIHACETTHSATPHPGQFAEEITDRLIHPEPAANGLRRSQRTRLKPVAWYKNEQVIFDTRRRSGHVIIGVKPSLEEKWKKLEEEKRKRRLLQNQIRKATQAENADRKPYRKLSIHTTLPDEFKTSNSQEVSVMNPASQELDAIDCIAKRDSFKSVGPHHGSPRRDDPYLITQMIDQPCLSAGKLTIQPRAIKPEQLVNSNAVVFYIEHGKMLVKIHETTNLLETGDTFFVPLGNTYSITNLRADTARLFYTLYKEVCNTPQSFKQSFTGRNTSSQHT